DLAAALLRGASAASPVDLWVLLHIWNRPEQISALQAIVGPLVERVGGQAVGAERDLAALAQELARLEQRAQAEDAGRAYTPTYFGTLLHDIERTRQELIAHSAGRRSDGARARWQELLDAVERLTDAALDRLEAVERI
ncbi:MAG: hypothetical protein HGA45_44975, partial [Chloroflexales bacterium]|nr:hypothetical protein [Chloroflexales bacterium]